MSNDRLMDIPTRNSDKLTYKQIRFVDEYMIDGNATQAAIRAGYGGNENSSGVAGHDLLRNPKIASEIKRRSEELTKSAVMSREEILELYTKIAKGEVLDQFGLEASLKDRLSALNELAKRQIDLPAKAAANAVDNTLTIKVVR